MSLRLKREELALVLSTILDVHGHPYRPSVAGEGDAWPVWMGLERDEDSNQFMATWQLRIVLPQDEEAASKWVDEHYELIFDALEPYVYVQEMEPLRLSVTAAGTTIDMNAVAITVRSE